MRAIIDRDVLIDYLQGLEKANGSWIGMRSARSASSPGWKS